MLEYKLGYFAKALCGHDKGKVYMIVSEEEDRVALCDGTSRPLGRPKYKNKKHVQLIRSEKTADIFTSLVESGEADRLIREEIRAREKRED